MATDKLYVSKRKLKVQTPVRKGVIFAQTNNLADAVARGYVGNVGKRKSKMKTPKRKGVIFDKPYYETRLKELKTPKTPNTPKGRKRKANLQKILQKQRKKRSVKLFVPEGMKENWRRLRRPLGEDESKKRYPNASNVSGLMI